MIKENSILVYGKYVDDEINIYKQVQEKGFNLKKRAKEAGFDVSNFLLNSGMMGRSSDYYGLKFAFTLQNLLEKNPISIFSNKIYYNDEIYVSIAFQTSVRNQNKGVPLI